MIKRTQKHELVYFLSFSASFSDFFDRESGLDLGKNLKGGERKGNHFKIITLMGVNGCKFTYCLLAG